MNALKRVEEIRKSYNGIQMDEIIKLFMAAEATDIFPPNLEERKDLDQEQLLCVKAYCICLLEDKWKATRGSITWREIHDLYPPAYPEIKIVKNEHSTG